MMRAKNTDPPFKAKSGL